jgi:hypothetical protein
MIGTVKKLDKGGEIRMAELHGGHLASVVAAGCPSSS